MPSYNNKKGTGDTKDKLHTVDLSTRISCIMDDTRDNVNLIATCTQRVRV